MGILGDARLEALLGRLHRESLAQPVAPRAELKKLHTLYGDGEALTAAEERRERAYLRDKMWALDRDKAEFACQLCRATGARQVVEAGTSFGVSTLWLAAAVRANTGGNPEAGQVIGSEYELEKAAKARANFAAAGLSAFIDLREGDLRETFRSLPQPVDFMLIDIWIPMARPALEVVTPHLRPGAVVLCDNTAMGREAYADYFAFLGEAGFSTLTLPFAGGLEMSVFGG